MRKRSLFLKGLSVLAIAFGMNGCAFGGDDKASEIVDDPLKTKSEYYIVGTVKNANGMISNAAAVISNDIKSTTNESGIYSLTTNEAKAYKLSFTADGHDALEATANIASGAANHSLTIVNVKLAQHSVFGPMYPANGTTIEIPKLESPTGEIAGVISIPAGGTDENTEIATVAYEEARIANPANSIQPQQTQASNNNIAIKTNPANAIAAKDIIISIPNPSEQASQGYFNTDNMLVESAALPITGAASPNVNFENNHYIITIPKGQNITGRYHLRVKFTKQAENAVADGYNFVNGKNGVLKLVNNIYSAQKDIPLNVKIKIGWDYTTTPAEALKNAGASEALATEINKYIEDEEGDMNGSYEIKINLTTSISGNHVLYYGSKRMSRMKTYTFKVIVNGESKDIVVKLKNYEGHEEEYTNVPISQHSGGGTGSQN